MITDVYHSMSCHTTDDKNMMIHQELKLGTEQEREVCLDFFSMPEQYKEIIKTLRRTSQVMYEHSFLARNC